MPNSLIHESSLYLRQHAHNPVDWFPWGEPAFEKAKKENKPVIVSIGYSSCHWCHVMEKECFEDYEVAEVMNMYFISIKVDREEHPDVDQWYMLAVQMLGGHGGWPLNVFCLPDGTPFYGGTYFPKHQWIHILERIHFLFQNQLSQLEEQARRINQGMVQAENLLFQKKSDTEIDLYEQLKYYAQKTDNVFGGENRAPKFPMPGKYLSFLKYAFAFNDDALKKHIYHTLKNMALRGLYDHADGGFYRYSTDTEWKIPHFEKMLYDNVQLLELYAIASKVFSDKAFYHITQKTADFLFEKMYDPIGFFYSSMDADSEGEEGKYYVWTKDEIITALGEKAESFFNMIRWGNHTHWEHDKHVLMLWHPEWKVPFTFSRELEEMLEALKAYRKHNKIPPILDKKMILSWNALAVRALAMAGLYSENKNWTEAAEKTMDFILKNLYVNGSLFRIYENHQPKIEARMEDYAMLCDALMTLFTVTGNYAYAEEASFFIANALEKFKDEAGYFLNYPKGKKQINGNLREIQDNVIPSSNSVMANVLNLAGKILNKPEWTLLAMKMLDGMKADSARYPSAYYRWLELGLDFDGKTTDAVFVGNFVDEMISSWYNRYPINAKLLFDRTRSGKGIFKDKQIQGEKDMLYICKGTECSPPLEWNEFFR